MFAYVSIKLFMENEKNSEIYSKVVRAGKRTYFFDVKSTKGNDYYITLTESKKTVDNEGRENFQKHKIFLYKEDFEKFKEGLEDVLLKINEITPSESSSFNSIASVSFED